MRIEAQKDDRISWAIPLSVCVCVSVCPLVSHFLSILFLFQPAKRAEKSLNLLQLARFINAILHAISLLVQPQPTSDQFERQFHSAHLAVQPAISQWPTDRHFSLLAYDWSPVRLKPATVCSSNQTNVGGYTNNKLVRV